MGILFVFPEKRNLPLLRKPVGAVLYASKKALDKLAAGNFDAFLFDVEPQPPRFFFLSGHCFSYFRAQPPSPLVGLGSSPGDH